MSCENEVLFARLHAHAARAASPLLAINGNRSPLQIALVADRDGYLLIGDEVLE